MVTFLGGVHASHLFPDSAVVALGHQIGEDGAASPSQAEPSDNRWDLECLPGLSTQEECVHACMGCSVYCVWWWTPAGRLLPTALWNTLEDDYNGEWLSLSLSSVSASPPTPSPFSSASRFSPIQHARSSVTPSPLSRLPITHTQRVRGNCCQGNSDSVARHLELCSQ